MNEWKKMLMGASNKAFGFLRTFEPVQKGRKPPKMALISFRKCGGPFRGQRGGGVIQDFHFSDAPCDFGVALSVLKS